MRALAQRLLHAVLLLLTLRETPAASICFTFSSAATRKTPVSRGCAGIADQYGLVPVGEMSGPEGQTFVVEGPESMTPEQVIDLVGGDPRVAGLEAVTQAALPVLGAPAAPPPSAADVMADLLRTGTLSTPCLDQSFPQSQWSGYTEQGAVEVVRLHPAQLLAADCGDATVAIIDTGVDLEHPALAGALVSGYDFVNETEGLPSSCWDTVDQSVSPIVEGDGTPGQSVSPIVEGEEEGGLCQSVSPIVESQLQAVAEASRAALLEGQGEAVILGASTMAPLVDPEAVATVEGLELPPFYGHGTMVAGLVRIAAPGARIMPLRAFNGAGTGHLFDIVRAIYYAVDHGADVINMSFSVESSSAELRRAMQYARSQGVVCVAAAGNSGESAIVYPAAYADGVGVASTTVSDELSDFSNYGAPLVSLAAPGTGVVSAYPGGLFAAGWGTSFSAPLVSGTVALIHSRYPGRNTAAYHHKVNALSHGSETLSELNGQIGSGRLDALGTVLAAGD